MRLTGIIGMEIKISLLKTLLLLISINFRYKLLKKTKISVIKKIVKAILQLELTLLKLSRKKNKAKNLNNIECYICKQKDYNANKYPEKLKN